MYLNGISTCVFHFGAISNLAYDWERTLRIESVQTGRQSLKMEGVDVTKTMSVIVVEGKRTPGFLLTWAQGA